MKDIINFLNSNSFGTLGTCNGKAPDVRPMEMVCSKDHKILFYLTENTKAYNEITNNSNVCFCATDKDYNYVKISATATPIDTKEYRDALFNGSTFAKKIFSSSADNKMRVFILENGTCFLHKHMNDNVKEIKF